MEENQTNQNLNQNPVQQEYEQVVQQAQQEQQQAVQQAQQEQPQQVVQQPVNQQAAGQPSLSMEIQQLLVQQQQYQQQYNQLVDYVKNTPNLPIDQVNQIKQQLDQLNALFVQGKQKLQELGYTQVQVNKPTEVKKGAKNNFSFKKLAIGCGIVVLLILAGFFVTLSALVKNPAALQGIGVDASMAKMLLQAFTALLFGSIILLMLGVIISNIYRLITVKNQSKGRYVLGLFGGLFGAGIIGAGMGVVFGMIGKIETEIKQIEYDIIQPYLVGIVKNVGDDEFSHPYKNDNIRGRGEEYPLIAPSEMAYSIRWNELLKLTDKDLPKGYDRDSLSVKLLCGNKEGTELEAFDEEGDNRRFKGTCLYSTKGKYVYGIEITYDNKISNEKKSVTYNFDTKYVDFASEVALYKTTTTSSSSNNKTSRLNSDGGEFILGKAPAKITVDSTQVFRDFGLGSYETVWDLDGDSNKDRENQATFDYSYKIPQVYYVTYKFPGLSDDTWYRFPVRVEQSDTPVCEINVTRFPGTTRYQISTDFVDASSVATISSYNYTIQNVATKKPLETLRDYNKEFNYTFPEKGSYVVMLDYVTIDGKQGQCESDTIELEKETFNVQYSLLEKDARSGKFVELCSSAKSEYNKCTQINSSTVPQTYHLTIDSIKPYSNTMKRVIYLNEAPLLNEDDTYSFDVNSEGTYNLKIVVTDPTKGMDDKTIDIKIVTKKADVIGKVSILDANTRKDISEGFEPLSVILDASKTEINVPGDEIVYFSWDFGDGEIKQNQQNGVVAHVYNFDYKKENGIFQPKVTITTREGLTQTILGPKLNVKKGLISVELSSTTHPSMQAQVGKDVVFQSEFDGLPEKMIWDFGDGSPTVECRGRTCTEIVHAFENTGLFSVKLTLEYDAVQQVFGAVDFKVF